MGAVFIDVLSVKEFANTSSGTLTNSGATAKRPKSKG